MIPLMLLPGFFPKAGLSRTAYLMIPYALEAIAVLLSAVCLGSFLYESKGKTPVSYTHLTLPTSDLV